MEKNETDINASYELTDPRPSALVESLRAFGYSLKAAIADLLDNSISAKAKQIDIEFEWKGQESFIMIQDKGVGMNESELVNAMRPGSKSPLEIREPSDLGRFGLGLKTASFSQCRKLTVISKPIDGEISSRCWDLDYVNATGEWRLLKIFKIDAINNDTLLSESNGTIVLLENLDRLVGTSKIDDNKAYRRFLESIEEVKSHLAMVFHRYLEKPGRLKITVNGLDIKPWDPFLKKEAATQELPNERLSCGEGVLAVTPYVLPHKSKISASTHKAASGPSGWNAQQGFYIYRNERLLVSGDWLGLGFQKEEHYKLARIQVDLPNSMDGEWQIDVKKSKAKPPGYLRNDFKRIGKLTRERAVLIYRHRGKTTTRRNAQEHVFLWEQKKRQGKIFYRLNRLHPLISEVLSNSQQDIEPMLKAIEETIPVSHIVVSSYEEPDSLAHPFENVSYNDVLPVLTALYNSLLKSKLSSSEALDKIATSEPFVYRHEFVENFKNNLKGE